MNEFNDEMLVFFTLLWISIVLMPRYPDPDPVMLVLSFSSVSQTHRDLFFQYFGQHMETLTKILFKFI